MTVQHIFFVVCGGSLTTSHGTFTSPLYPQQYTHRRQCKWDIEVESGRSVTLTFDDFDLESSEHCIFDGIHVSVDPLQLFAYFSSDLKITILKGNCD